MKNQYSDNDDLETSTSEYEYYDYDEFTDEEDFDEEDFGKGLKDDVERDFLRNDIPKKRNSYSKKKKRTGKVVVILIGVLVFAGLAFGGGYFILNRALDRANYIPDSETISINSQFLTSEVDGLKEPNPVIVKDNNGSMEEIQEALPEEVEQIQQVIMNNISDNTLYSQDGVTNILLIGVDKRDDSYPGNSDSMILLSINKNKRTVTMNSLMRDLYTGIEGMGTYKLNSAHAIGGAPLLVQTVEKNLKIDINYYATIDFIGFISVIDTLGGVPMTVTEEELPVVNKYIYDLNVETKWVYNDQLLTESGDLILTGRQALGYSRVRSVGNADFERTDRQRRVLSAVMEKIRSANILDLTSVANSLAPYITHNIPRGELMGMVLEVPEYLDYQWYSDRVPYDGLYKHYNIGGQGMLVPDWTQTIEQLRASIYD